MQKHQNRIAVLIPCYNEAKTIGQVVSDFKAQIPDADIYVFDNNSTDKTSEEARLAGAIVRFEPRQGKGNVIRSMFRQIDADVYVMVDGDNTYPAEDVHELVKPVIEQRADMVVGSRLINGKDSGFRLLNLIGNKFYLSIINTIYKVRVSDLLSGYRAFSRRLVKTLPLLSQGFDIETELTLKAIESGYSYQEIPVQLTPRAEGSHSKINIVRDGILILNTIMMIFRDYKPLTVFGLLGFAFFGLGLWAGLPEILKLFLEGRADNAPLAVLSVGLSLAGLLIAFVGLILHAISRRFQELESIMKMLAETTFTKDKEE